MCEGKSEIEKSQFIRILGEDTSRNTAEEEWVPYIANELAYFIVNNGINLSQVVNPRAKVLTRQQGESLLQKINFKPS